MDEKTRIKTDIEKLFCKYQQEESLINALVIYVDYERFNAKHDGAMYAIDKVRESFDLETDV